MKHLYNLLGDLNHGQVTDYTFELRDPTNAAKFMSTEKAMSMVDKGMERHEKLKSLPVLVGEQNDEKILLKENREKDK
eukprot:scaffold23194_cov54-Attheya_sp.AAC.8